MTLRPVTATENGPSMLVGLIFSVVLLASVPGCSASKTRDDKSKAADDKSAITADTACSILPVDEASEIFGAELTVDADSSAGSQCALVAGDGPQGVTVTTGTVSTDEEFLALVSSGADAVVPNGGDGIDGADASLVWEDSPNIAAGAARVGGAIATVRILSEAPHEDLEKAVALLSLIIPNLAEEPFSATGDGGELLCSSIPIERVRTALDLESLEATPLKDGCVFSDDGGVNLIVTTQGGATSDQLEMPPAVTNIDGVDHEWIVETVPDLGDGAVWTLNPVDERSGELITLFGEKLVRISSSASEPGPELKDRAVAVARIVGAVGT